MVLYLEFMQGTVTGSKEGQRKLQAKFFCASEIDFVKCIRSIV